MKPKARGFSLIEILVVVVIVGVTAAVVALSVRGSGEREVENAAQRARALVRLACERAIIGGRDIGFSAVSGLTSLCRRVLSACTEKPVFTLTGERT